jgi:Pyruvate/2-oxoacid:ferredoxin oxidoreductase gamma subunit
MDDTTKAAADSLNEGISFGVTRKVRRDSAITEAIERRKTGYEFLTAEQSLADIRDAVKAGSEHAV